MEVSPTIFRAYDIRGVYPSEINEDVAHHIGKAAGTFLMRRGISNCVLGRDNRESSPALCVAFIEGIKSTGCDVTYVDITTSPMIYFLTSKQDFGAGVNVTASHNPKQFNGFRFCYGNAVSFSGEEVASLYDLIIHEDYEVGEGTVEEKDLSSLYIDYMKENFHFSKKFKVAVNCGNGATSIIAPAVFEALGCEVVPINCVYDSNFPHGIPNPQNEIFMKHLSETVLKSGADAGFAFDTDGDRFDAVAEDGVAYGIEKLLLLLSEDILKEKSGGTIIFDVKASALIEDYIKSLGGVPKMLRTGHGFFIDRKSVV